MKMSAKPVSPVARYFGAQVRKHRMAAKLSLTQLADRARIDLGNLSKIEHGHRGPTADTARKLDAALFPDNDGNGPLMELYEESQTWVPPAFRRWAEYEDKATRLLVWSPYTVHGLLQTRNYARVVLSVAAGVTEDQITGRLNERMNRQQRILYRDEPPHVWFVVDELSLYRRIGSAEIMAEQCAHVLEVAALPNVTLTVMPAVEHNADEGGFIVAEGAAYAESAASKGVYTDHTVTELLARFGNLSADSYGRSQSLSTIKTLEEIWARGASPLTAAAAGETA